MSLVFSVLKFLLIAICVILILLIVLLINKINYFFIINKKNENSSLEIKFSADYLFRIIKFSLFYNNGIVYKLSLFSKFLILNSNNKNKSKEDRINKDVIIDKNITTSVNSNNNSDKDIINKLKKDDIKNIKRLKAKDNTNNIDLSTNIKNKSIVDTMVNFLNKIHKFILNLIDSFNEENINKFIDLISNIKKIINKLLKCIMPKQIFVDIDLGLDDPYQLGQVLSITSYFYSIFGNQIQIRPHFNNKIFTGIIKISGDISLISLLNIIIIILRNKQLRKFIFK